MELKKTAMRKYSDEERQVRAAEERLGKGTKKKIKKWQRC